MRISTRVKTLLDLLERVEWAGSTWSVDYPTCCYCFETLEDCHKVTDYAGNHKINGHRFDCEWLTTMQAWGRK